jgi:hypothetical protein
VKIYVAAGQAVRKKERKDETQLVETWCFWWKNYQNWWKN